MKGEEFRIEGDTEGEWLNVIDSEGRVEQFEFDGNDCVSTGGEYVTKDWSSEDFEALNK